MPLDSAPIESQIDLAFPDNVSREIKPVGIRVFLKTLVRWVRDAINNNQTTWLRTSDGQPGGANSDDVYRVGVTRFKGGIEAYTKNTDAKSLSQVPNDQAGLRVSSQNGGPAYIELHHPGIRIDKIGTDKDGVFKYGTWGSGAAFAFVIDGLTKAFRLSNDVANKKIVLNDSTENDNQFYGFGINPNTLRYQVDSLASKHAFYAGSSPATSNLLMVILGNGQVGIGVAIPGFKLDVQADNPANGILAQFQNTRISGGNGALVQIHQAGIGIWRYGVSAGSDAFIIQGYGGGTFPERLRIDTNGNMGVGTPDPTARLHVKSPNGFDQLRLENRYTPTGPNDPNGQPGNICWDDTWFYHKTTQGWRRIQFSSW
ncbi:hypothetical protein M0L20_18170 [Spirosoma sp. RP8]|uniref:Uncharacterized protein n=1 Tax=Spirosoma liriopis TaxID=2937440 RepID=A0ABT0HNN8_9BACT|nr:hypothetical protein [Spirosoma liriopis]MCK8493798.1 hypothetical protein [Spirosoma liriopis]